MAKAQGSRKPAPEIRKKPKKLTDAMVEKVKAEGGNRTVYPDTEIKGFELRVSKDGFRSFSLLYRVRGEANKRRVHIGDYPTMKLGDARELAARYRREAQNHKDPRAERKRQAEEQARLRQNTLAAAAEAFISDHVAGLRSAGHTAGVIRRELISRWGKRPVAEITADDVGDLVDGIKQAGKPYLARLALAHAKTLFEWIADRPKTYGVTASPCARITAAKRIGKHKLLARDRVLTDDELRRTWKASLKEGYPFGDFTRLMLLTGLRRCEASNAHASEFHDELWTIPGDRMKGTNPSPHEVPLSSALIDLLKTIPDDTRKGYLFSTDGGKKPISGFGKAKDRLDVEIARSLEGDAVARPPQTLEPSATTGRRVRIVAQGHEPFKGSDEGRVIGIRHDDRWGYARVVEVVSKKQVEARVLARFGDLAASDVWLFGVPEWRNHDLRRTMRTRLSELRVPDLICELTIGHAKPELHKIYDQHKYRDEKRDALERWAKHLVAIINPSRGGNVFQMRSGTAEQVPAQAS
jgi:integrase